MDTRALGRQLVRIAGQVARGYLRDQQRRGGSGGRSRGGASPADAGRSPTGIAGTPVGERREGGRSGSRSAPDGDAHRDAPNPGDWTGDVRDLRPVYRPEPDGRPDTGEVVWAWVPYEDDPEQGKDRPVLLIGQDDPWLLALMLTSKDHDRDAAQEARAGRRWMDVGSGPWDRRGRPSEVRLNRVLRLSPEAVRREGSALDREVFEQVAQALANGW